MHLGLIAHRRFNEYGVFRAASVSHIHCQQLSLIRDEFDVARVTISYVERAWPQLPDDLDLDGIALRQIQRASRNLEDTYVIRAFAEFEGIIRDYLPAPAGRQDNRSSYTLINRVALRCRIPDPIRDDAQAVREYRNSLTHGGRVGARTITFQDVIAALNKYLARLP